MLPAKNHNQTTKMEMMSGLMKKLSGLQTETKEKEKIIVQGIRNDVEKGTSSMGTETKEKEKIIVQGIQNDPEKRFVRSIFYEIDMAKGFVKQIPHVLNHCMNSITSIGSVIYVVGGIPSDKPNGFIKPVEYRTHMFYLNLDSDSDSDSDSGGWKEFPYIPPINAYRHIPFGIPTAVSLGGKVYVFAGRKNSPFALVFNSNTDQNQWDTLLPPSDVDFFNVSSPSSAVADPDNNRLLVHFKINSSIYAYYPSNNTWELIVDSFGCSNFLFANGVFYIYLRKTRNLVMAFDTVTKQWLEIEFTSEVPYKMWAYKHADMLYLGDGLMCLVDSMATYGDSPGTLVSVYKFRFKRCTDRPGVLIITPLPLETYNLNTFTTLINYYPF